MDESERLTRLQALAHPARLQILSLLTGTAMSAAEVARELGTTQANATHHRVFWAVMEGVLAAVLLIGGGLTALQTASVSTGLPFAVVLLVLTWSLHRAFTEELDLLEAHYDAEVFRSRHGDLLDHINREEAEAGRSTYVAEHPKEVGDRGE